MHLGLRTVGGKELQQRPDTPALERVCEGLTESPRAWTRAAPSAQREPTRAVKVPG